MRAAGGADPTTRMRDRASREPSHLMLRSPTRQGLVQLLAGRHTQVDLIANAVAGTGGRAAARPLSFALRGDAAVMPSCPHHRRADVHSHVAAQCAPRPRPRLAADISADP
jgi:hypothetical protein